MSDHSVQFTSRFAAILTLIGVAVGLGNVWRFPYMMGKYGGSAFLVVYLLFTLLFAIPALMAEIGFGRAVRGGTLTAFRRAFGSRVGTGVGILLLGTVLIAGSYYAVVVANVIFTSAYSVFFGFSGKAGAEYNSFLANGWLQYLITLLTVAAALFVIDCGLRNGIERISKFVVPFFIVTVLGLVVYAISLPGAVAKLSQFLSPDFTQLTPDQIFAALGQSFFSVGLGGTFMLVYGGYLNESESIPKIAVATCFGDVGASLMASLFLVPTILVFGLDIASGPVLIFETLPALFGTMYFGRIVGSLFLIALSSVAFLSLIAAYEVFVSSVDKEALPQIARRKITVSVGILMVLLTLPSNLYPSLIGTLDLVFGSGMQIFGSVLAIVGISWGLGKGTMFAELLGPESISTKAVYFWIKWIVPAVLLSVLTGYIYSVLYG
ncbi:MAG: sodium-dependent transporter [Pyrinomonadaceae bacterium]